MSSEQVMSLREHLSELKRRAKISFASFIITLVVFLLVPADPATFLSQGYYSFTPLVAYFISRVKLDLLPPGWTLIVVTINEPLEIYIVASLLFALIFNTPIFAYEVIKFISPGLNESEKKLIYPFVGSITGLFAFGVTFGYFFLAKFLLAALTPFFTIAGVNHPTIDVANFYFIVLLTIGMSGVAFTVPVYVYTLIRFGIVQASTFRKNRIIIWAVTYILCAIITPDGGPLLDVILFVPIIVLLELAVFIGGRTKAARSREAEGSGGGTPAPLSPSLPSVPPSSAPSLPAGVAAAPPPTTSRPSSTPAAAGPQPPPAASSSRQNVCPFCSTRLAPGTVFCPNCGRSVE